MDDLLKQTALTPEEFFFPHPAGTLKRRRLWNICFALCLAGTLATGSWLWLSRISWTGLAMLYLLDAGYAIKSIFFFAAFFHPSEFLPHLFFSLKHFHIAVILSAVVKMIKNKLADKIIFGIKEAGLLLLPLFLISAIATCSAFFYQESFKTFQMTAALTLIFCSIIFILGLVFPSEKHLRQGVAMFVGGVSFQILTAFFNSATGLGWLGLHLIHNNHLGIISGFSSLYALSLALTEHEPKYRKLFWAMTCILFSGILFSCSRTAWLSFSASYFLFFILVRKKTVHQPRSSRKKAAVVSFIVLSALIMVGLVFQPSVFSRIIEIGRLADLRFWQHTFQDYQNFGFFGIYRLNQLYDIAGILARSPLFGVGMTRQVVDFHSLYFTILGASGLLGLGMFFFFVRTALNELRESIRNSSSYEETVFRIGAFCALAAWLLTGFMETLILQYAVWMNVLITVGLIRISISENPRLYDK